MTSQWGWRALLCCTLILTGCTPALNWRQVSLGRLTILLPCKPDRASRAVSIADAAHTLDMVGCEAAGALFAVSHISVGNVSDALALAEAWKSGTLNHLRARDIRPLPLGAHGAIDGGSRLAVTGSREDASVVQAQMLWVVAGGDVFHAVVFADQVAEGVADQLFGELRLH